MKQAAATDYLYGLAIESVAWLFVILGIMKMANRPAFRAAVVGYRLLGESLSTIAAVLIPPAEIVPGILMLVGRGGVAVPLAMSALLLAFSAAIGLNLVRGRDIDCGCDGGVTPSKISWAHVRRNVLLSSILLWIATHPPQISSLSVGERTSLFSASLLLTALYVFGKAPLHLWRHLARPQQTFIDVPNAR